MDLYPGAVWRASIINHPMRPQTLGVVIHWTAGSFAGDVATLDGPTVDVHFYVAKSGQVVQFLDPDSMAWHAMTTANRTCVGIETEGRGEAWTPEQLAAVARLTWWLCERYEIPVRRVDPSGGDLETFRGIFGHRDLSVGGFRVDGNDHTDSVPEGTGWPAFLAAVRSCERPPPAEAPFGASLRLQLPDHDQKNGWAQCIGPMRNIARNGLERDNVAISWRGWTWRGAHDVAGVVAHLLDKYDQR